MTFREEMKWRSGKGYKNKKEEIKNSGSCYASKIRLPIFCAPNYAFTFRAGIEEGRSGKRHFQTTRHEKNIQEMDNKTIDHTHSHWLFILHFPVVSQPVTAHLEPIYQAKRLVACDSESLMSVKREGRGFCCLGEQIIRMWCHREEHASSCE